MPSGWNICRMEYRATFGTERSEPVGLLSCMWMGDSVGDIVCPVNVTDWMSKVS